jgi:hypothetical protein
MLPLSVAQFKQKTLISPMLVLTSPKQIRLIQRPVNRGIINLLYTKKKVIYMIWEEGAGLSHY